MADGPRVGYGSPGEATNLMTRPDPGKGNPIDAAAAVVIVGMVALLGWRTELIGPTVDEPLHLVRGLAWWWTDSTRLSFAHPPLANVLQAFPAWFADPIDLTALRGWGDANHAQVAAHLVEDHYDVVRPLLVAGRRVTMALGVVLALAVYVWTSWRFGRRVGLVALLMVAFNPTVLAHAQLVTTDLPVTLAIFGVTATFVEYLWAERPLARRVSLAGFAVAVAVALCTKFTALALIPVLGAAGLVWAAQGWGRFADGTPGRRLARLGAEIGAVAVVGLVGVAASYRFEEVGLSVAQILAHPEPQCWLTIRFDQGFLEQRPLVAGLPEWLRLPVPYTWLFGVEMVRHHGSVGHGTWFAGHKYALGHPAYFPVLLLVKTPWVVLLGFGLAVVSSVRTRRWPSGPIAILLIVAGSLLLLLMRSHLNIGVRHALPLVPLVSVVAANALVPWLEGLSRSRGRWGHGLALGLLLSLPVVAAARAGSFLSWFNIGSAGYALSVVGEDWGQDTVEFGRFVRDQGYEDVVYLPYGIGAAAEVRHQGADVSTGTCADVDAVPPGKVLAVHLADVKRRLRCLRRLVGRREPDLTVANHILVWRTPYRDVGRTR